MIELYTQAIREAGYAVVVISPQDIQTCGPHDDDHEPKISHEDATNWLRLHKDDVEEAILGDYWGESIYPLLQLHPIEGIEL
jgi:hypothetical protein